MSLLNKMDEQEEAKMLSDAMVAIRSAAELVIEYRKMLTDAGLAPNEVLYLTAEFQRSLLANAGKK